VLCTVALVSVVVTIASGAGATMMLSCFVADSAGVPESVTLTVNVEVPVAVGVPLIAPVLPFNESPAGRFPALVLHVRAPAPPVEVSVTEYATPTVAAANGEVDVIDGDGVTITFADTDLVGSLTDVAVIATVRLEETVAGAL